MYSASNDAGGLDCTVVWNSQRGLSGTAAYTTSFPTSNSIPTASPLNIAPGNYLPGLRLKESFSPITSVTSLTKSNDEFISVSTLVAPPLSIPNPLSSSPKYTLDNLRTNNHNPILGSSLGHPYSVGTHYNSPFVRIPATEETMVSLSALNNMRNFYVKAARAGRNYNVAISASPTTLGGSASIEVLRNGKTGQQIMELLGVPTGPSPISLAFKELETADIAPVEGLLDPSISNPSLRMYTVLQHKNGSVGSRPNPTSGLARATLTLGMEVECSSELNMFVYKTSFASASRKTRCSATLGPIPGMVAAKVYRDIGDGWAIGLQTARLPSLRLPGTTVKSSHASTFLVSKSIFPSREEMNREYEKQVLSSGADFENDFPVNPGYAVGPKTVAGVGLQTTGDVMGQIVHQYSPTLRLNALVTATGVLRSNMRKGLEFQTSITYE